MGIRKVQRVVQSHTQLEGGGFPVRRPFPGREMDMFDPFLLLDQMGPVEWGPREAIGAPTHPHRGFETVTYVLEGRMQHRDSHGHQGDLNPGDVQWMTAGDGLVHSELPHPEFYETGGVMHGFQLWVNLPQAQKRMQPRYQELTADALPVAESDDGKVWVRVIAGQALGVEARIDTVTPINYLHYVVQPGGRTEQRIPDGHNAFAWVVRGQAAFDDAGSTASEGQMAVFGAGETVRIEVSDTAAGPAEFLLLSGKPLREPVARYGPFVMNTKSEILEAINDFRAGRMGTI